MSVINVLIPKIAFKQPELAVPIERTYQYDEQYYIGWDEGKRGSWEPTSMDFLHIAGWMGGLHNNGHIATADKPVKPFTPPFGVWF